MSKWIQILVEVLIFMAVIGGIAYASLSPDGNITGASKVIIALVPLVCIVGFVVYVYKKAGGSR